MQTLEKALTMQDVAKRLDVTLPTIYRLINTDPDFKTFKVGRMRRMREDAFDSWIRNQEQKAAA